MENKNIILLKHHPMNVKFTNTFYLNQTNDGNLDDFIIFDVTSRILRNKEFMAEHPTFAKDLSPFYIGPVLSSDGVKANVFEIFWQFGKVYACHNDNGKPNKEYFEWRNKYYSEEKCSKDLMRHACKSLGYEHKDTLYFAYFNKDTNEWEALNYVEARKKVYFPEYIKLIYNTESLRYLKSLVDAGKKIALVDFDALNIYSSNARIKAYESYVNKCKTEKRPAKIALDEFMKLDNMKSLISCPFLGVGHGVAIKALLEGDLEVVNGQVIDHIGLLK